MMDISIAGSIVISRQDNLPLPVKLSGRAIASSRSILIETNIYVDAYVTVDYKKKHGTGEVTLTYAVILLLVVQW